MSAKSSQSSLFSRASECLAADPRVQAVYLFGSRARGDSGPRSDVDIAVLLDRDLDLRAELRLRARIVDALGRDDVDLVVLNRAGPLLRYEVVATGTRLAARDERAADKFERRAFLRCCDTERLRAVQQRIAREALAR